MNHYLYKAACVAIAAIVCLLPTRSVLATPDFNEITAQTTHLSPQLIHLGYIAYQHALNNGFDHSGIVTLIDYSQPDTMKRLWVIDYKTNKILFQTWAAQGKGTGIVYAHHFSNQAETHATSIGVYKTGDTYFGKHGISLRLIGLDPRFNGNANARGIVVHGAPYVSPQFIRAHGYLGRSWGCVALDQTIAEPLIHTIKDGTILIAYYPNPTWLKNSAYLQPMWN